MQPILARAPRASPAADDYLVRRPRPGGRIAPAATTTGHSLAELLIVVMVMALLLLIGAPKIESIVDRAHVAAATAEIVSSFAAARHRAVLRGTRTALSIDALAGRIAVHDDSTTFLRREVGPTHGVTLDASRDSMAYYPNGMGFGAANLSIIVGRNRATDTIFVSRLGRVRH